ncbi:MAG: hypothetical protein JSR28_10080 [Proteobacteria bacterium]|nr:hypothetical protein [Pseudomonadota bacterium]
MAENVERARRGEGWWTREVALRGFGMLLLYACYRSAALSRHLIVLHRPHQATLGEFAACLAVILLLASGLAMTALGSRLFGQVPVPPHSDWYWR